MLETPATTKNKVSGDEHRDATNTALHAGAAPDPACLKRNRSVTVSGDPGPLSANYAGNLSLGDGAVIQRIYITLSAYLHR